MDMTDYQNMAKSTAIYPREHAILYPLLGLANEAGEVLGKYKKYLRGDYSEDEMRRLVHAELGDVLWYLACVADDLGTTLSIVAERNLDKLATRKVAGTLRGDGDNR